MDKNTFGDYQFEEWVPEHTRDMIRRFWGQMGRTHKDWLANPTEQGLRETCSHGPNPNGFGLPPNGAMAFYFVKGKDGLYKRIKGQYVHRWNNMGSLIDDAGEDNTVSTCDMWVRVWKEGEIKT